MAYRVMACIVMAYIVMAYRVMAYIVMAYIVMAYTQMSTTWENSGFFLYMKKYGSTPCSILVMGTNTLEWRMRHHH